MGDLVVADCGHTACLCCDLSTLVHFLHSLAVDLLSNPRLFGRFSTSSQACGLDMDFRRTGAVIQSDLPRPVESGYVDWCELVYSRLNAGRRAPFLPPVVKLASA